MRETVNSLKAYFILVSVLGIIGNISVITTSQFSPLLLIPGLIGLTFSVAYLYVGMSLRKLLRESPTLVKNLILASMAYLIINSLLSLLIGFQTGLVVQFAVSFLLIWYILSNVKRLSQEEKSKIRPE